MDKKIVVLDADTLGSHEWFDRFSDFGSLTVYGTTSKDERIAHIADASIIITNKVLIDAEIIDSCPQLTLVCLTATGMNNVDIPYANSKGIEVKNVAGYSTESVAQHTFAMLLSLLHHTAYYAQYVSDKKYSEQKLFTHIGPGYFELSGKTWGIIGLGTIGKRVAEIAKAFGCKVIYYSTSGKNLQSEYEHKSLQELLQISDFVSIHAPLNPDTLGLLSYTEMARMKPSSYLINVGRGGIVVEDDLSKILHENKIMGACLDVLQVEPLPIHSSLLDSAIQHKLLITPHVAWISKEALQTLMHGVYLNVKTHVSK